MLYLKKKSWRLCIYRKKYFFKDGTAIKYFSFPRGEQIRLSEEIKGIKKGVLKYYLFLDLFLLLFFELHLVFLILILSLPESEFSFLFSSISILFNFFSDCLSGIYMYYYIIFISSFFYILEEFIIISTFSKFENFFLVL